MLYGAQGRVELTVTPATSFNEDMLLISSKKCPCVCGFFLCVFFFNEEFFLSCKKNFLCFCFFFFFFFFWGGGALVGLVWFGFSGPKAFEVFLECTFDRHEPQFLGQFTSSLSLTHLYHLKKLHLREEGKYVAVSVN